MGQERERRVPAASRGCVAPRVPPICCSDSEPKASTPLDTRQEMGTEPPAVVGTQRLPRAAGAVTAGGSGREHEKGLWETSPAGSGPSARAGPRPLGPFPAGPWAPAWPCAGFWGEPNRVPRATAPRRGARGGALGQGAVISSSPALCLIRELRPHVLPLRSPFRVHPAFPRCRSTCSDRYQFQAPPPPCSPHSRGPAHCGGGTSALGRRGAALPKPPRSLGVKFPLPRGQVPSPRLCYRG